MKYEVTYYSGKVRRFFTKKEANVFAISVNGVVSKRKQL